MRKFLMLLILLLLAAGLAACDGDNDMTDLATEPYYQWTVEELGETIVAAGTFWEDWWYMRGRFGWENFEQFDWGDPLPEHYATSSPEHSAWLERQGVLTEEYMDRFPEHLHERGTFGILLPTSGFTSLNDIREYLLRYYTPAWIDAELHHDFSVFVEYDGVLFVDITRAGFVRPNWETATHAIIEQSDGHVTVETTVLTGAWHREPYEYVYPVETQHRFVFVDGKIDGGRGAWDRYLE